MDARRLCVYSIVTSPCTEREKFCFTFLLLHFACVILFVFTTFYYFLFCFSIIPDGMDGAYYCCCHFYYSFTTTLTDWLFNCMQRQILHTIHTMSTSAISNFSVISICISVHISPSTEFIAATTTTLIVVV